MCDYRNGGERRVWLRLLVRAVVVVVVALIGMAIYGMDPDSQAGGAGLFGCGFKRVTGLECPGCGATRAVHYLMHGSFAEAFRMNPAFVGGAPFLMMGVAGWLAVARRGVRVPSWAIWAIWVVVLVLVIGYWVVRNQAWWPWKLP